VKINSIVKKKLDLGRGNKKRPGAIGVDINVGPDDNSINSMRGQTIKALAAALKEERARTGGFAAEIESLRAELLRSKRGCCRT
jgi:hypothetical protein